MGIFSRKDNEFTEAYNRYYALVFSVVYSRVRNESAAEDITQEVFLRFYEKFNDIVEHRKWLYGTLRNVCFEYFRRHNVPCENIEGHVEIIADGYDLSVYDTNSVLREALDESSLFKDDSERVMFELVAIHNYSYRSTARQLGTTEHKVRYRFGILVKNLLSYLEKKGISRLEDII